KHEPLTDDQWEVIKGNLNWQRKRKLSLRKIFDAILWITRTGSQWRNMESKYPPWQAVYYYFYKWSRNGLLKELNFALNSWARIQQSRARHPSLGIVESQSVKLAPLIYEYRGIDGHKLVNGRKRQLLVDVLGRIWKVAVHPANIHDSKGGLLLLEDLKKNNHS
ncbi:MAG: IS5 family transposase, partial [Aureispira sp.]|nr:IS5 family transposase [Aureispira sp.]